MDLKKIITLIVTFLFLVAGIIFYFNRDYPDGRNTLYSKSFDKDKIKFERYDYSLGQNQTVGVEISHNKGRTYEKVTDTPIIVSMEPMFVFLDKKIGFAISKPNLQKYNKYKGVQVTHDGGKTFTNGVINYENPNIEIITVEEVPYKENNKLILHCSIYQVKEDLSGYEDKDIYFESIDKGLTWNLK